MRSMLAGFALVLVAACSVSPTAPAPTSARVLADTNVWTPVGFTPLPEDTTIVWSPVTTPIVSPPPPPPPVWSPPFVYYP